MPNINTSYAEKYTVADLLRESSSELALGLVAGEAGTAQPISAPRIQKPGLALTGYCEQLHRSRVLVIGATETEYLSSRSVEHRVAGIQTMMDSCPACVVVTTQLSPDSTLLSACKEKQVPLITTKLTSAEFIARVTAILQERMAPQQQVHGVMVDVLGVGVLLLGKSGIGKSEAALELVVRGHRFIADDIVMLRRKQKAIYGSASSILNNHMEIRGLGIVNIKDLFGISSVCTTAKVDMVVELAMWDDNASYDRLGVEQKTVSILDVSLPQWVLPVRPGRNLAMLIEVSARNYLLKSQGHDAASQLVNTLRKKMVQTSSSPAAMGDESVAAIKGEG